jgi:hypothetical protein
VVEIGHDYHPAGSHAKTNEATAAQSFAQTTDIYEVAMS